MALGPHCRPGASPRRLPKMPSSWAHRLLSFQAAPERAFLFTTHATRPHWRASFRSGDRPALPCNPALQPHVSEAKPHACIQTATLCRRRTSSAAATASQPQAGRAPALARAPAPARSPCQATICSSATKAQGHPSTSTSGSCSRLLRLSQGPSGGATARHTGLLGRILSTQEEPEPLTCTYAYAYAYVHSCSCACAMPHVHVHVS